MFFECLSYMSYMYTRKHHKRTVQSGGETPDGKIPLPLMTKRGRDLSDAEDRGMVPGGA
jgi:hypothetical protein